MDEADPQALQRQRYVTIAFAIVGFLLGYFLAAESLVGGILAMTIAATVGASLTAPKIPEAEAGELTWSGYRPNGSSWR
jgi:hypothetical protein